jgi:Ser/Thr protein kinase RdoA (MazF antagonist)
MTESLASHPLADRFKELGPVDVLRAVEDAGHRCTGRQIALNSYENRVYQLDTEDTAGVVAKFYRPGRWSVDAIEDEHDFMYELDEAGVPVSLPLELEGGYTVGTMTGETAGIHYALYERVVGRVNDEPDEAQLQELGRLVARIHHVGARSEATHRQSLGIRDWGRPSTAGVMASGLLPTPLERAYVDVTEALFSVIEESLTDVETHRIHGDCHHANLLWDAEGPVFLDFDDAVQGPAAQDIWMLAPSADQHGQWRRTVLLGGYREVRDFDDRWLRLIEPLRALRMIRYTGWIAQRWHDPMFQRTFSYVLTESWWSEHVRSLRELQASILEGG